MNELVVFIIRAHAGRLRLTASGPFLVPQSAARLRSLKTDDRKEKAMPRIATRFRILAGTAVIALTLSGFAGTAAAASGPAEVGACNMIHALFVGANGGLFGAWVVENANGWDGKWVAVAASGCPFEKFPQP